MDKETQEELRKKLDAVKSAHRALDEEIAQMIETQPFLELEIKRMKKRKLALKDLMATIEDSLVPDIIA